LDVSLFDNDHQTVAEAVEEICSRAHRVRIAVAFAKGSGLAAAPAVQAVADRGGRVELLAGLDFQLTDLDALRPFERPPSAARVYLNPDQAGRTVFHPKLYLAESNSETAAIVGSSNFTAGGLQDNVEANVLIRGTGRERVLESIRGFHNRLWTSGFSFSVTDRFRGHYELLQNRRLRAELALRAEADFAKAQRDLRAAVVEAVTTYESERRRCWLLITSPENFIWNIEGGIWGDEQRPRIAQVRPGDLIYFYITRRVMALGAMGMVTREAYEDHTPYWPDGRIYPYRFGFALLLKPKTPIPFRSLVPQLDLFRRRADPNWGQRLQTSMRALSMHDCEILRAALLSATPAAEVA
jgi:HKD family nuclease